MKDERCEIEGLPSAELVFDSLRGECSAVPLESILSGWRLGSCRVEVDGELLGEDEAMLTAIY